LTADVVLQVCDEGHRLKAKGGNKTIDSLLALNCPRRVVLTGTPVQNNLEEFYGRRGATFCDSMSVVHVRPCYVFPTKGNT
jgi:hypothetical protein